MHEPRPLTGELRVRPVLSPDGTPSVALTLPDGSGFIVDRETTLSVAFALLNVARGLFPTPQELERAVLAAEAGFRALTVQPEVLQ